MRLQALDLLADRLQILRDALEPGALGALAGALFELAQLSALVVEQLVELLLDERGLRVARAAPLALGNLLHLVNLVLEICQLALQPHLLPVLRLLRRKVRARRLEAAAAESRQVLLAKLGLAACARRVVGLVGPARVGTRVSLAVELVIDLVALETGAKRRRDCAGDAESIVAVVEDVQKREAGVLVDAFVGRRVDEVPCGSDVGVWNVKGLVQVSKTMD